jgi:hypothetical protein
MDIVAIILAVFVILDVITIRMQRKLIAAQESVISIQKETIEMQKRGNDALQANNAQLTGMLIGVPQLYPSETSMNN